MMAASIRVNGEPLDPSQWEGAPESKATSDIKKTPHSYEKYDPLTWLPKRHDAVWKQLEEKTPQRTPDFHEIMALFAPIAEHAGPVEVAIYGTLAMYHWGIPLDVRKPCFVDQEEPPFLNQTKALEYLVDKDHVSLGIGPVRLDFAEEKDEHRTARAAAKRNGVEHIKTSGSFVGSSHVKGERAWIERFDIIKALSDITHVATGLDGMPISKSDGTSVRERVPVVWIRALIHKDVGERVPINKHGATLLTKRSQPEIAERLGATEAYTAKVLRDMRDYVDEMFRQRGLIRKMRTLKKEEQWTRGHSKMRAA